MFIVLLFAICIGGGWWLGRTGKVALFPKNPLPQAASTINTQALVITQTPPPVASPTATLIQTPAKTISAGASASAGLAFSTYTIQIPLDWNANHEYDWGIPTDTLTISKGAYKMKIYQAATGGSPCVFPGDTPADGLSTNYSTITQIAGAQGARFRRGSSVNSDGIGGFTICQQTTDGGFMAPTNFGHIQYSIPANADPSVLSQMDAMVASLVRQ